MGRGVKTRSYYLPDGTYFDVTTGRTYQKKEYCEICGANFKPLFVHHFLDQQKCMRDVETKIQAPYIWTQEFINENQKLFTLCNDCHKAVERKGNGNKTINGRLLKNYLYRNEEKQTVTVPRAFVVKKNDR